MIKNKKVLLSDSLQRAVSFTYLILSLFSLIKYEDSPSHWGFKGADDIDKRAHEKYSPKKYDLEQRALLIVGVSRAKYHQNDL